MRRALELIWLTPIVFFAIAACSGPCSTELISTSKSSAGHEAGFFRASCGATTGYVYEVRVAKAGASLIKDGETVLRFDDNHAQVWPSEERDILNLSWEGGRTLYISVAPPVRVFKEDISYQNISLHYEFTNGAVKL